MRTGQHMCKRPPVSSSSSFTDTRRSLEAPATILLLTRIGILLLCVVLSILSAHAEVHDFLVLALVAVLCSAPLPRSWFTTIRPYFEAAVTAAIIGSAVPLPEALLPYLIVPPLAAGLLTGARSALISTAISFLVLLGARVNLGDLPRSEVTTVAEWVGLGLAVGLVGSWARIVGFRSSEASSTYVAAHELLTRLRDVARSLPTGLDEVSLAQQLLVDLRGTANFDRAGLYVRTDSDLLMALAFAGADRLEWQPDAHEGIWEQVWKSGGVAQQSGTFSDPGTGYSAVVAMKLDDRPLGLVGFEREGREWADRELLEAQRVVNAASLSIETGRLFSEIRAIATVEERRRLAREIHDGIAQEIASVAYVVDDLRAHTSDEPTRAGLSALRAELTRIVTELRLSIFDLRTDVQPAAGLGAALTGYVHTVGSGAGLTVHLVLDESSHRLPLDTEAELLRVAQEAITNARKHARARNLWVTCRVDPPRAFMRIADDGQGLGQARADSFGMEIMRERAQRLGASLSVRARVGGGTVVEIALGSRLATPTTLTPANPKPALPERRGRPRRR